MTQVVRYRASDGQTRLAVLDGASPERARDAGPAPARGFVPTPEAWRGLEPGRRIELPRDGALCTPVDPPKLLGIGLNYRDHAAEGGVAVPERPMVFAKLTSSTIASGEPIVVPRSEPKPDWEAELALVVGTRAKDLPDPATALAAIGGYTAFNDVSGRYAQHDEADILRGKGFDTFGPIGPAIRSADGVRWDDLAVRCVLSGETVQDGTTAEMVFGPAALVQYLSHQFTLEPGDVIATGTPAGVGFGRQPQRWLQDGEVVEVTVGEVGPLRSPVRRR